MDFMEFSRDTTRFRREAQYLPRESTCQYEVKEKHLSPRTVPSNLG